MVDLREQYRSLQEAIDAALRDVLASGRFILGPQVDLFEEELAAYLDREHVVTLNSGTDALLLALRACDIGPGDEVIVPAYTFVATASAVILAGARPVFVDCAAGSFNLDPAAVEAAVGPRTRAVIPVHLFGGAAPLEPLVRLCGERGLRLIEDAAQAIGATYLGEAVGGIGHAGAFSFYPSKNLGAYGDGGAVVTDDADLADELRSLRDHGRAEGGLHVRVGTTSRLDEIQAAILRVKLPHLDEWNASRRFRAQAYRELLEGTQCELPLPAQDGEHVYHQFVVSHPRRDAVREALSAAGVSSAVYYPVPCHLQPAFAHLGEPPACPVAERWAGTTLALPIYPELPMPALETICRTIRRAESLTVL
ncbi:MAG: DegT/DnrJ/EryC1/StrS family aminotransferase [Gemmatimonadota bacterium]